MFGHITDDGMGHRLVGRERVSLVEHADAYPVAGDHASLVGLHAAIKQGQQAGLAVTIAADDADAVAFVDAERHGIEDHLCGVLQVQGLGSEQKSHEEIRDSIAGGRQPRIARRETRMFPLVGSGPLGSGTRGRIESRATRRYSISSICSADSFLGSFLM